MSFPFARRYQSANNLRTASSRTSARPRLAVEALEDRAVPTFLGPVSYPGASYPQAVATADFNNDSFADLALANYGDSTVSVLLGNGDGSFDPAVSSPADAVGDLAVGDFNEDGRRDLVTLGSVLLGNGDGTFAAPMSVPVTLSAAETPMAISVGDLNGDGNADLVVTSREEYDPCEGAGDGGWCYDVAYRSNVNVLLGNGDGVFGTPIQYHLVNGDPPDSVALADLNIDGKLDVVVAEEGYGSLEVLLGKGDGTLNWSANHATGFSTGSVAVGDVNGDSRPDLITEHSIGVSVLFGDGLGGFSTPQNFATGYPPAAIALADFNRDGNIDIAAADYSGGKVTALLFQGNGTFTTALHSPTDPNPWRMAAGDFDGDGWVDLATASQSNVSILINDQSWQIADSPSLTIDDVTVTEGNTGTVTATFTVQLSAAGEAEVTVQYRTANSTAAAGSDYQAPTGVLSFAPGETSKTITVLVNGDWLGESNEMFFVRLSTATNASIADGEGTGTILDDEPRISITDVTMVEGKKGQTSLFVFTITLSAAYDEAVTMSFQTNDGSAKSNSGDYIAKTGAITFNPGETTKTITIEVKGDSKKEANETFYLDLFGNSLNSLFTKNRGIGTIWNDD